MSMDRKDLMEGAIRKAHRVLDLMGKEDEVCLLLSTDLSEKRPVFSVDKDRTKQALSEQQVSWARGDLISVLTRAEDRLIDAALPNKEVFIISDLQATGFETETEQLPPFEGEKNVFVLPVSAENQNLALVDGGLEKQIIQPGAPLHVFGVVKNYGERSVNEVLVRVFLSDKPVAQKIVSLGPGETKRFPFRVMPEQSGWIEGAIHLEEDVLLLDNRSFFTAWIPEKIRVRLAGTSPEELDWIRIALDPSGRNPLFEIDESRYGQRRLTDLHDVDVLFLSDYPRFDLDEADKLRRYIEGGGGLVLIMGDHADLRNYNERFLSPVLSLKVGNVLGGNEKEGGYLTLGSIDEGHPFLEGVFEKGNVNFRSPHFRKIVEIVGRDFLTLFTLTDGHPFLIEKRKGEGGVFLLSSGLKASWSDLPFSTIFAPLLFRSAVYLSAPSLAEEKHHIVGKSLTFMKPVGDITSNYTVETPSGERILIKPDVNRDRMSLTVSDPKECGVYRFEQDGNLLGLRAVNIDPRESNLGVLNEASLNEMFPAGRVHFILDESRLEKDIQRTRWGREFWREMLLLCVIVLIAESVLARENHRPWTEPISKP